MFTLAHNTFRELIRNKILYIIAVFGVIMLGFSTILNTLALQQVDRILIDTGLAMIEISGIILVIFVGSQILFREIEGKTVYLILSKPIQRRDFILGKFLGFSCILLLILLFQSIVLSGVLKYFNIDMLPIFYLSLVSIFLKLLILFTITLFFSTIVSPLLSIFLSLIVFFISHGLNMMMDFFSSQKHGNIFLEYITHGLYVIFPNLGSLNIKSLVFYPGEFFHSISFFWTSLDFPYAYVVVNFFYAVLYIVVILFCTLFIFRKKQFEN